jgi:cobalamin biosynthetic protein CobC
LPRPRRGFEIIGGTALFRLAQTARAEELFRHLGRAGILTRRFPDHARWLRFGLPASEGDWRRLRIALAAFPQKPGL